MNCYLTTIYHTGTQYFKATLDRHYRVSTSHLNESVINQLPDYSLIFTTYRYPLHVAASWANRDRFKNNQFDRWEEQYTQYAKLKEFKPIVLDFENGQKQYGLDFGSIPINQHQDKYGLHKAINEGNTEELFNHIPPELIEYAVECSEWAKG